MENYMTFESIYENIENKIYEVDKDFTYTPYLSHDTVIDEEKSVRWNREEVERKNAEEKQRRAERNNMQCEKDRQFKNDIVSALMNDYKFSEKQANKIAYYGYADGHSDGYYCVLEECIYYADIVSEVMECK